MKSNQVEMEARLEELKTTRAELETRNKELMIAQDELTDLKSDAR